jgi:hypothetical protein
LRGEFVGKAAHDHLPGRAGGKGEESQQGKDGATIGCVGAMGRWMTPQRLAAGVE